MQGECPNNLPGEGGRRIQYDNKRRKSMNATFTRTPQTPNSKHNNSAKQQYSSRSARVVGGKSKRDTPATPRNGGPEIFPSSSNSNKRRKFVSRHQR